MTGIAVARSESAQQPAVRPVVSVRGATKDFAVPHEPWSTVKDRFVHPLRRRTPPDVLEALRDVTFEIERGDFFGIVGKNGGGKSTLLRCMCGIYPLDAGEIGIDGRLAPFIELGVGFNPELSARDNLLVNGVLLGLPRAQARERVDEMLAFAGIEEFADMKLKNCSAGMTSRLGFAVTVEVQADVLLFDEVLAVGDAEFQRRCLEQFERLRGEGRTVVLVSHDMQVIEERCNRALLLDHGRVAELGDPAAVARGYERINREQRGAGAQRGHEPARKGKPPQRSRPPLWERLGRLAAVTRALAVSEFRLRYLDAGLSYLWAVMRPLAFFGVLLLVFTQIGNFDSGVVHYPLYLLTAIVLWTFFAESTASAVGSLVRSSQLLRTLPVPRLAVPLSVTLTSLLDLCMTLVAVFTVFLIAGLEPRLGWLELPLLVGLLALFVAGLSMLLSVLYVRYRDITHIWQVGRQTLFYLSPIFYVVASLPESVREVALANPLAAIFTQMRHALIDPDAPTAAAAIGGTVRLLVPLGIIGGTFGLGLWLFQRRSARATELL